MPSQVLTYYEKEAEASQNIYQGYLIAPSEALKEGAQKGADHIEPPTLFVKQIKAKLKNHRATMKHLEQ